MKKVFDKDMIDNFLPLCETYGVENDVATRIKSVLDGLVVDDLGIM